jgi:hypothetical protein
MVRDVAYPRRGMNYRLLDYVGCGDHGIAAEHCTSDSVYGDGVCSPNGICGAAQRLQARTPEAKRACAPSSNCSPRYPHRSI